MILKLVEYKLPSEAETKNQNRQTSLLMINKMKDSRQSYLDNLKEKSKNLNDYYNDLSRFQVKYSNLLVQNDIVNLMDNIVNFFRILPGENKIYNYENFVSMCLDSQTVTLYILLKEPSRYFSGYYIN